MKIHNKLIKSTTVTEKGDLWGNFIITILTRTGLHRCMCISCIGVLIFKVYEQFIFLCLTLTCDRIGNTLFLRVPFLLPWQNPV